MKAENIIGGFIENQMCSILSAEKLTRALIRDEMLDEDLMIRFRPLLGDFDIIERRWYDDIGRSNVRGNYFYFPAFTDPKEILDRAQEATQLYYQWFAANSETQIDAALEELRDPPAIEEAGSCDCNCLDCKTYYNCESELRLEEATRDYWLSQREAAE